VACLTKVLDIIQHAMIKLCFIEKLSGIY